MTVKIMNGSSDVTILASKEEDALKALEATTIVDLDPGDTLEGILESLGFYVSADAERNINDLAWGSSDDDSSTQDTVYNALAPFVEDGGYNSFILDNDNETWVNVFDRGRVRSLNVGHLVTRLLAYEEVHRKLIRHLMCSADAALTCGHRERTEDDLRFALAAAEEVNHPLNLKMTEEELADVEYDKLKEVPRAEDS